MSDLRRWWPERLAARPDLRDRLAAAYAGPDRGYHDSRHLREVLTHLDVLLTQPETDAVDRDTVVLAAWFHDAVYDARPDDEERSAALAEETLTDTGLPAPLVAEVARLVRLTRHHRPGPDDLAGQLLCDADLAILAADRSRYDDYVRGVRREHAHVEDRTFRPGRAEVLRELLAGGRLFHTPLARQLWEAAARDNVERELAVLAGALDRSPGPEEGP